MSILTWWRCHREQARFRRGYKWATGRLVAGETPHAIGGAVPRGADFAFVRGVAAAVRAHSRMTKTVWGPWS